MTLVRLPPAAEYWRDVEVAAYSVAAPALRFPASAVALRGLPSPSPAHRPRSRRVHPLVQFSPLQGASPRLALAFPRERLSWGSCPFSTIGPAGYSPGFHARGSPTSAVSTACAGLHPAGPFRAYFIPEALLGFSPSGVSPRPSARALLALGFPSCRSHGGHRVLCSGA